MINPEEDMGLFSGSDFFTPRWSAREVEAVNHFMETGMIRVDDLEVFEGPAWLEVGPDGGLSPAGFDALLKLRID